MSESLAPFESSGGAWYGLEMISELSGLTRREVLVCYRAGLVQSQVPAEGEEDVLQFDDAALYVLRRLAQVRATYGVNLEAARLICELLDEVEQLRAELDFWRHR